MQTAAPFQLIGNRYELHDILGQGGMGAVYRTYDRLTGQMVALKRLLIDTEQLIFNSRNDSTKPHLALAREFQTLASLRHPHIISVLDYGFDSEQQPYFTMSLLEKPRNIRLAAAELPVEDKIRLIIQILQALAYLHRRGIVHRDLKPGNVLVDLENQIKVLDFGLAVDQEEQKEAVGTLAYMAPEVIKGSPASRASDLYAVGLIMYEIIAGEHPFDTNSISRLTNDILQKMPDLTNFPAALAPIVERLVAKDPAQRYQDAAEVIRRLALAADLHGLEESSAIRESFLQSARFVGRETELSQLLNALDGALHGRGSSWLIGGESGVGKSRLMDELRTRALVNGAQVLRGQAIAEGGAPYLLWHDILRSLCLQTPLSDLEAGTIKALIPDIGALLNREIDEAPELDLQAAQNRLLEVIEAIFKRQNHPIVVLLEDLHWNGERLLVLQRLIQVAPSLPLLIVGNFRDDEMPNLPDDLPQMTFLKVERLNEHGIADLSASILGDLIGRQPDVLGLLKRETEGNAFFIVEVVRALAEEAGQLSNIGQLVLPTSVFAKGIKSVIQRRLNRVPDHAKPLLELAAVIGRRLDLKLLASAGSNGDQLEAWLTLCANASILEVRDDQWWFAHDKLRDGVLDQLNEAQRKALHRAAAELIESVYSDASSHAAALVEHWHQIGDVAKEAHYAHQVGEQAFRGSAFQQAYQYLERALWLLPDQETSTRIHVQIDLGEVYMTIGDNPKASRHLQQALSLARQTEDHTAQAQALFYLSQIGVYEGNLPQVEAYLAESLPLARQAQNPNILARVLYGLGYVAWHGQRLQEALELLEESLSIARANNDQTQMVFTMGRIATIYSALGNPAEEQRWNEEALKLALQIGNRERAANIINNMGAGAWYRGEYAKAGGYYEQALQHGLDMGHKSLIIISYHNLGLINLLVGDIQKARTHFYQTLRLAVEAGITAYAIGSLMGFGGLLALQGNKEKGLEWLGLALNHPALYRGFADDVPILIKELWADCSPELIQQHMELGKSLNADEVLAEIQAEFP